MFLLSLPMRERGLKSKHYYDAICDSMSLPMRERGLKYTSGSTGIIIK